ncbi:MAG: hypothetical protein AAF298_03200 [Cyanobacteria bacterium P01_A01_bin.40]
MLQLFTHKINLNEHHLRTLVSRQRSPVLGFTKSVHDPPIDPFPLFFT